MLTYGDPTGPDPEICDPEICKVNSAAKIKKPCLNNKAF